METDAKGLEIVAEGLWLTPEARAIAAKAVADGHIPPPSIQTEHCDDDVAIQT